MHAKGLYPYDGVDATINGKAHFAVCSLILQNV